MHPVFSTDAAIAIPLHAVTPETWTATAEQLGLVDFVRATGFDGAQGALCLVPGRGAGLAAVLYGLGKKSMPDADSFIAGKLPTLLPAGTYKFMGDWGNLAHATLAFLLGSYRFERYKTKPKGVTVKLVPSPEIDVKRLSMMADAVFEGRDLINTPANDLGPAEIEAAIRAVANEFSATVTSVIGDELLAQNYPMIHAVGRASNRAPRLVDLHWGNPSHPKVTLVGKGVAFDTGGLNIKPDNSMLLMKKDMGGAAVALAAARMVMAANLPICLRLIVPTVENSISGSAFRPGDVLQSRKGISVEIGNTDAEGRLILGDALTLADEDAPDLVLDFATLTGAARVALGPDLPPVYTDDETLAADIAAAGMAVNDPVWRMPLWKPYSKLLDSKVADINHISSGAFAGSVTAALFLQRFVEKAKAWAHFDVFCWVPSAKSGRPEGGEVQAARLAFELIEKRYGG